MEHPFYQLLFKTVHTGNEVIQKILRAPLQEFLDAAHPGHAFISRESTEHLEYPKFSDAAHPGKLFL